MRGLDASVRAIATRWRMPPDSSAGIAALEAVQADQRDEVRGALQPLGLATPAISSGNATFSSTVRHGNVDSSWNTMPIAGCVPGRSSPATVTRALVVADAGRR